MKNKKTFSRISTIALTILLTISIIIVALPQVSAQTKATYAYLGAVPNPVGVNQQVLLHVGITDARSAVDEYFDNLTVAVTKPDGTTESLGPFRTDSTGGTGGVFVPTMVGTYQLQTIFPEQVQPYTPFFSPFPQFITYQASVSEIVDLVVQEDPIPFYPGFSQPTEYWTRPIDGQMREWSQISGSWLDDPENLYAPYNDGPETAHILWAKPFTMGGLVGGDIGPRDQAYTDGDAYQGRFSDRIIISGILVYNRYHTGFGGSGPAQQGMVAIDARTGEELWFRNNTRVSFGQTLYFNSQNQHGAHAVVWDNDWNAYYADNGEWAYSFENVPSGTQIFGPNGEILRYRKTSDRLLLWNSTAVTSGGFGFTADSYNPDGIVHDASRAQAYTYNISIPAGLPGGISRVWQGDRMVGASASNSAAELRFWGIDLTPSNRGELLFNTTWSYPANWVNGNITIGFGASGFVAFSQEDRVAVLWLKELRTHYGFSLETGEYLWGPSETQYYLDAIEDTIADMRHFAYGKLYCASVSGIAYCYDAQTGELEWVYEAEDPYSEILWANNWWLRPLFITDGKIYLGHGEHSAIDPKPRGAPFICLDAMTGEEIWRVNGLFRQTRWGGRAVIGDSVIITQDLYDQRIYSIGKGPSQTTVDVRDDISLGKTVTVTGSVVDVSPGTEDIGIKLRFPNGVPAVSDADMSEWMLYVYKNFPAPSMPTGVFVSIESVDPNGNWQYYGTATTDVAGNFALNFEPEVPGLYMLIATFQGTEGYYGSYATTYVNVEEADPEVVIPPYPGYQGPSAQEVANRVLDNLPDDPTAAEISDAVISNLPEYPEPIEPEIPEYPEYRMIDIILTVLVAIAIVLCIIILIRKR